jgi:Methyltransferase domain
MDWRLRVMRLALIGRVPLGDALRRAKRRLFGYAPDPGNLRSTLRDLEEMKAEVAKLGRSFRGAAVLEIGSGWFPSVPVMLCAEGARHVYLTDLTPHMDEVTFTATLDFLKQTGVDSPTIRSAKSFGDFPMSYLAPFTVDSLPDGSIDFVISRTVLEHIPEEPLRQLLAALKPKLAPGGLMVHCVDHSDHLEHSDKSISKINFLTWSDRRHALVNWLTREGENRLRHHEYLDVFKGAGFDVLVEKADIHDKTLQIAPSLNLVGRFREMRPEQLAVLRSIFLVAPGRT